jgi:hypothetical protein
MSDPAHPTPATPEKKGGQGKLWGIVALLLVVSYTGALTGFGREISNFFNAIINNIGNFFQMLTMNKAAILLLLAAFFLMRRKKKDDDHHPPGGGGHP